MRLIYHDQEIDPRKIYKKPDSTSDNFVSDSEIMRKIIFQILAGKSFAEYYEVLAELKDNEKQRLVAKNVLAEFINIQEHLLKGFSSANIVHLREDLDGKKLQLGRLLNSRKLLKVSRPGANFKVADIELEKAKLLELELQISEDKRRVNELLDELIDLEHSRDRIVLEVTQINKILYTHETLGLFSPDTCPYCLKKVQRQEGSCVCGSSIDELTYEKFFYDSSEYTNILKSKQKSVETLDFAIEGVREEVQELNDKIKSYNSNSIACKMRLSELIKDVEPGMDTEALDDHDDKILSIKDEIRKVEQAVEVELRREALQRELMLISTSVDDAKRRYVKLESEVYQEINSIVLKFSTKYDELMRNSLKECRSARINPDTYLPLIDEGLYREASSTVAIRFNYFICLLYLSLTDDNVVFPRFLMIDTPDTAGIDEVPLKKTISQISNVIENQSIRNLKNKFQILLTTGLKKYPADYSQFVFQTFSGTNKLLQSRATKAQI